jgi:hypothetical protein
MPTRTAVMREDVEGHVSAMELREFEPLEFDDSEAETTAETIESRPSPVPTEWSLDSRFAALVQLAADGTPVAVRALERPFYSIGRGNCKIRIDDPRVSRFHVSLIRVGGRWVAINRTEKRAMQIAGWNLRQKTLERGDAIRIGETWLVYVPAAADAEKGKTAGIQPIELAALKRVETLPSLDEEDETALLVLRSGGREIARTSGRTVMIGAHDSCDATCGGPGAAPFRCFLNWTADGPAVVSLGPPVLCNNRPVSRALLCAGTRLQIDGAEFQIELHGDLQAPARERLSRLRQVPRTVRITAFHGPHRGTDWELAPGRWIMVGRKESCGIAVPKDSRVADVEAEVVAVLESLRDPAMRPIVRLRDVAGGGSTLINRDPVENLGSATIGDVIQFGTPKSVANTALLVHYPLTSDAWLHEREPL